jgi:hypothetical protein
MKKQILRSLKIFVKGSFLALMLTFNVCAVAQQPFSGDPIVKTASIKHISTTNDKVVFQLSLDNEAGDKFSVSIKDAIGSTIFYNVYQEKKFDKKFVLERNEDISKLTFVIRSFKDNTTQTFEINTATRVVENYDVSVRKL